MDDQILAETTRVAGMEERRDRQISVDRIADRTADHPPAE